jgi:hypothetical protein
VAAAVALTAVASAVATIVLATAAAAVEAALISDTTAMLTRGEQFAADGRPDGDDNLRQSPCSKNGKPYKTETKDIDTQASDAILALGVGYRLTV